MIKCGATGSTLLKDGKNKLTPYIVPWKDLEETIKHYDRDPVKLMPEILDMAGLKIYRIE